jgi:hypothetical protein
MNIDTVLTVLGTLAVAIIGVAGGYILQSRASLRERKWAAETERKRIENEKRKVKYELISKRVKNIEEAANIFMFLIETEFDGMVGLPVLCDSEVISEKRKRIDEISLLAHTAVKALDSPDLEKSYGLMASIFWDSVEEPGIVI